MKALRELYRFFIKVAYYQVYFVAVIVAVPFIIMEMKSVVSLISKTMQSVKQQFKIEE